MPGQQTSPKDWPDDNEAILEFRQPGMKTQPEILSVKDVFEGVQVFGATGSGKSSGSGAALIRGFLEANFGGLVLTVKTDERLAWENYAKETGRTNDLLIFSPEGKHRFNFLRYELSREGRGAGHTENLVNLFCTVMEAGSQGGAIGGNDGYWLRAVKQLLRNAIDLLVIGLGDVNLPSLYKVIVSAPNSLAQAEDEDWQRDSICYALIEEAGKRAESLNKVEDFELTRNYWLKEFAGLAHETRSPIVSMFTSMADCFLRGLLQELFCTELNFTPEDCFKGKIILIDLPGKEFHELGIYAQMLFKYIWQRQWNGGFPLG